MDSITTLALGALPPVGQPLEGGLFFGISTQPDGQHVAAVLLPGKGDDLTWQQAMDWAAEQGGQLPTRPLTALLFANLKAELRPEWHWLEEEAGASYAWFCSFGDGYQGNHHKSWAGSAVAVRLIPLSA